MIGGVSIGGVYLPALLLLALIALVLTGLLTQLFSLVGVYRVVANRPLVDLCAFTLLLGLLAFLTAPLGLHS